MLLTGFGLSWFHLEVIVQEKVSQDHFDLRTRKESARAGPDTVAKVDVVEAGHGMLVFKLISGDLPEL